MPVPREPTGPIATHADVLGPPPTQPTCPKPHSIFLRAVSDARDQVVAITTGDVDDSGELDIVTASAGS